MKLYQTLEKISDEKNSPIYIYIYKFKKKKKKKNPDENPSCKLLLWFRNGTRAIGQLFVALKFVMNLWYSHKA